MEILLGIVIGAALGIVLHFALPRRETRSVALAPLVAAAAGAVSWTALTWAGLGVGAPLLWIAAVVVPLLIAAPVVLLLAATRTRADERERQRLGLA